MRSVVRCMLCCLLLLAGLTSCRKTDLEAFIDRPQDVQEIQFAVSRIGEGRVDVVKRISDTRTIKRILEFDVGGSEPYTRHVFIRTISFILTDSSKISVTCEYGRNHGAIRIGETQYKLPKSTADQIQSFYNGCSI